MTGGRLDLRRGLFLAPMAGITNPPFRLVCRLGGADAVWSEMVSARAMRHGDRRTRQMALFLPGEHPVAAQVFGSEPDEVAEAASTLADAGADLVDVNMACPVKKILKSGAGVQLMREPSRAEAIVRAAAAALRVPLTVKIRLGWSEEELNFLEFAKRMEGAGAAAVILHPRTKAQGYSGKARWEALALLRESLSVPVVASGDVVDGPTALALKKATGCEAIMIGRGALGRPWVFRQVRHYLESGEEGGGGTDLELVALHVRLLAEHLPGHRSVGHLRKHLGWYSRGMAEGAHFRALVNRLGEPEEIVSAAERFFGIKIPLTEDESRR